jgi:hypothetical protein
LQIHTISCSLKEEIELWQKTYFKNFFAKFEENLHGSRFDGNTVDATFAMAIFAVCILPKITIS